MSLRINAEGKIESVKVVEGQEYVHVVEHRGEIVDVLSKMQATLNEVNQDLAEFDALEAQRQVDAAAPAAPAEAAAPTPPVPDPAPEVPAAPEAPAEPAAPINTTTDAQPVDVSTPAAELPADQTDRPSF